MSLLGDLTDQARAMLTELARTEEEIEKLTEDIQVLEAEYAENVGGTHRTELMEVAVGLSDLSAQTPTLLIAISDSQAALRSWLEPHRSPTFDSRTERKPNRAIPSPSKADAPTRSTSSGDGSDHCGRDPIGSAALRAAEDLGLVNDTVSEINKFPSRIEEHISDAASRPWEGIEDELSIPGLDPRHSGKDESTLLAELRGRVGEYMKLWATVIDGSASPRAKVAVAILNGLAPTVSGENDDEIALLAKGCVSLVSELKTVAQTIRDLPTTTTKWVYRWLKVNAHGLAKAGYRTLLKLLLSHMRDIEELRMENERRRR